MSYRMNLETFDNSAVNTRQVRRQRARLAAKHRTDTTATGSAWTSSKYMPHNGKREMARRVEQAAFKAVGLNRKLAARWPTRRRAA
jgi:hypothetical protein